MQRSTLDRITRMVAAVTAAIAMVLLSPPASASTIADDVTWGASPTDNEQGSGRPNFDYTVEPGDTIQDGFVISNYDDEAQSFTVYAADAMTTSSGALDLLPSGTASTDVGAWVTLAEHEITVPAGQSLLLPFSLVIPRNATPGDHTGGIVSALVTRDGGSGISVERRLGSRMHIRVAGALTPNLDVEDVSIEYQPTQDPFGVSDAVVRYTVVNTGNSRLTGGQRVSVTGPFGMLPVELVVDDLPELLPGSRYDVEAVVPGVRSSGFLTATVAVVPRVAPESPGPDLEPRHGTATVWAIAWLPLSFLVLVLAVAGVLISRLVRRRREPVAGVQVREPSAAEIG